MQFYIERKRKQGILSELNMERFTVVSVDNIDFLQRHAFVYCGDQSRSWHGTTVQAVQPLGMHAGDNRHCTLSLQRKSTTTSTQMTHDTTQGIVSTQMTHGTTQGIVSTQSTHGTTQGIVATQSTHATTYGTVSIYSGRIDSILSSPSQNEHMEMVLMRKRTAHPTPDCSPSTRSPVLKKAIRRARRGKETGCTHYHSSTCSSPRRSLFLSVTAYAPNPLQSISRNHYDPLRNNYTIGQFHTSNTEECELSDLRQACFMYMLTKTDNTCPCTIEYSSLTEYLSHAFPVSVVPSKYIYLDVLDQNADCRETISDVLSGLHKEFSVGTLHDYLVVAGDAKTYKHLQSLKLDYGEELSWLLPFPGDFHILKNLQPVLSKVYFDIGLKQLAIASGFRGETLTSLQKCSHFKKTHNFIFQSWEAMYMHMLQLFVAANPSVSVLIKELNTIRKSMSVVSTFNAMRHRVSYVFCQFTSFL